MQKNIAVSVKNLSKRYKIGRQADYINFRDTLVDSVKKPFRLLIPHSDQTQYYYALRNINFEINQGETIGIIGKNGAGKSTLLKILSRITYPSEGELKMRGRVASLLEVGTGFSFELTGRENIYLNGAILGMKHRQIAKIFDKIVEFAEIQRFLDTPVKHYSSGMHIRTAFAIAAFLDADIMLFDEVLNVGDSSFQERCLGKIKEMTHQGRSVVMVSHNMGMIRDNCHRAILLENSSIQAIGNPQSVINTYLENATAESDGTVEFPIDEEKDISLTRVKSSNSKGIIATAFQFQDSLTITLDFYVKRQTNKAEISIGLTNSRGINVVFTSLSEGNKGSFLALEKGYYSAKVKFKGGNLVPDLYFVKVIAHYRNIKDIDVREQVLRFTIEETGSPLASYGDTATQKACVITDATWELSKNNSPSNYPVLYP